RFAHAVSLAVAEVPSQAYNPLFIYGGVGLGKTHLMHAIGHYAHELHPEMNIVYITSEDFTNQLVTAMQTNRNQQFRDRFRTADILMVDDIQFIAGKSATEEEFFHTFNHLKEAGKQIIMTSDKPPREIQKLEERLCSRFEGGLNADIQRPDFETRLAILRKKAEFEHLVISDDVLELIAERIDTNVRELEGSLTRLTAYSGLTRRPVDMQLAQEALKELLKRDTRPISTELIQESVAAYYGITVDDLKSPRRNHDITVPRQIAMYLVREMMGLSLTKIGEAFGGRHYTTVMSSIEKVEKSMKVSPSLTNLMDDIRRMIKDAPSERGR
ncbi:MAG: chromosomal replication initiator protein DnaA, partial [Clostridia bacterium]|nr:chromosomal replication initiator protein DnaA [Clostridia bacterium]